METSTVLKTSLVIVPFLAVLLLGASSGGDTPEAAKQAPPPPPPSANVDLDLAGMNKTMKMTQTYLLMTKPRDFAGKTVRIAGGAHACRQKGRQTVLRLHA